MNINQNIIHQRTTIYNRKTRSKKSIDKLVWCKNCGIFMEANRYYIEMYLYYLYYLINTKKSQFDQKKDNQIKN